MAQVPGSEGATGSVDEGTKVGAVVLGMSRSGTSAATRALVTSGFYAGAESELLAANCANPAGFWENKAVIRINDEILARTGGTWITPPTSEAQLAAISWAEPKLRKVLGELLARVGSVPVAIKDPRIGLLTELWGPVIETVLHPVLVVRNPVEIARSLATRDGTPAAFGLASWEVHTARLLEYLHGRDVTVAPYAALLRSPEAARLFVGAVAARLTADRVAHVDRDVAPTAIEAGLHHSRASFSDLAEHLTGQQAELWEFLDCLPPGNQTLSVPLALTRPSHAAVVLTRCETDRVRQHLSADHMRAQLAGHKRALLQQRQRAADAENRRGAAVRTLERERAGATTSRDVWSPPGAPMKPPDCPSGWSVAAPDFVGVGAQRCGTTWWDGLVADHPGVCRPPGAVKELHFFDRFVATPVPDSIAADYARWFPRPPGLLAGEWTPRYMLDFWTPRLLARCAPAAKLIVCLRDPVERFRSGMTLDPAMAVHVLRGLYHVQLVRLLAHFPREQILVLQHEACLDDPARELRRTYRFLGLTPEGYHPPGLRRRINSSDPRAKPTLSAEVRDDLAAFLLTDLLALAADFPEIDLDRWPAFAAFARDAG